MAMLAMYFLAAIVTFPIGFLFFLWLHWEPRNREANYRENKQPTGGGVSPPPGESIADALLARVAELEAILTGFHTDTQCGSCKGPLEEERDAICKRCTLDNLQALYLAELAAARAEVERLRDCLSFVPGYDLHDKETPASFTEAGDWIAKRNAILNNKARA